MPKKSASQCVNMDSLERTQLIHDLDTKYNQITHQTELLVKDEESRRMRLRSMVLRDEASSLKDQIAKRDAQIKALHEHTDDTRSQLDSVQDKCRRQEKLMQAQTREISNLKAEMSSLGSVSQDSAKILSEKLALTRELAVLKPEIEHLRSQLAHQKDVLADKLALERQLNALEVELANEKRAVQKVVRKQDQESQEEAELRKRVQELEKQLAKEKKVVEKNLKNQETKRSETESELESRLAAAENSLAAERRKRSELQEQVEQLQQAAEDAENALVAEKRAAQRKAKSESGKASAAEDEIAEMQERLAAAEKALDDVKKSKARLQKEYQQAMAEAETRQEATDAKLEKLRSKLRETQEELKTCRADLERAREQAVTIPKTTTTTIPLKKAAAKAPAKKRSIPLEESILQTPGQDDRPKRPLKKRAFDPSAVGKSEFSITPFLNKTVNLSDESLKVGGDDTTRTVPALQFSSDEATTTLPTSVEPTVAEPAEAPAKPEAKKPRVQLKKKPLADAAPSKKNLTARAKGKTPLPEPVLEKVAEEPDDLEQDQENRSTQSVATAKTVEAEVEPKKKKRKLLGAANKPSLFDEDEGERVVAKRPPKTTLNGVKTKVTMGGTRNAFTGASFSPLKRDRRGVGASFLA